MANYIAWVQCRVCSGAGVHPYARRFPVTHCRFCDGVGWYDIEPRAKGKDGNLVDGRKGKGKHGEHIEEEPATEEEPAPEDELFTGKGKVGKPGYDEGKGDVQLGKGKVDNASNRWCDPPIQFGKGKGRGGQGRYHVVRSSPDCIVFVALPRSSPLTQQMPPSTIDEPG